jgi:hypothetical protein
MDNDTTDLILTLYSEEELSEYGARMLLDDETIDRYNDSLEAAGQIAGQQTGGEGMAEWPDDIPMPYGHLSEEEYYVEGTSCR